MFCKIFFSEFPDIPKSLGEEDDDVENRRMQSILLFKQT